MTLEKVIVQENDTRYGNRFISEKKNDMGSVIWNELYHLYMQNILVLIYMYWNLQI